MPKELIGAAIFGVASITDGSTVTSRAAAGRSPARPGARSNRGQAPDVGRVHFARAARSGARVDGCADHWPRVRDHRSSQPAYTKGITIPRLRSARSRWGRRSRRSCCDSRMASRAVARAGRVCGAWGGDADRRGIGGITTGGSFYCSTRASPTSTSRGRLEGQLAISSTVLGLPSTSYQDGRRSSVDGSLFA